MKFACLFLMTVAMLHAQESAMIKAVKDRTERGTLSDQRQLVRGDTGKWNDAATLQHAPPLAKKPQGLSLDDWSEQLAENEPQTTAADDNWLIFRTRQLDDNDRVWIEKIERSGNEFTITMHEAIWQGNYFRAPLDRGYFLERVLVVEKTIFDRLAQPQRGLTAVWHAL